MAMFKRENWGGSAKIACTALLSGIMALSMPMTAMAETYYLEDGNISVAAGTQGQTVTQNRNTVSDDSPVISNRDPETPTSNNVCIYAAPGQTANVTLSNVNIDCSSGGTSAVYVQGGSDMFGNGTVNIELDDSNVVKSASGRGGVEKDLRGTLTIKDEDGNGSLTAVGGDGGAGIGGNEEGDTYGNYGGSDITISGGNIVAVGGSGAAGIGGGRGGTSNNITLSGSARVSASGGQGSNGYGDGAAIGGGGGNNNADGASNFTNSLNASGVVNRHDPGASVNDLMDELGIVPPQSSSASAPASSGSSDSKEESSGSGNNNDSGSPSQPTVNGFAVFLSTLNTQIGNNLKQVNSQIASGNLEAAKAKYPDGYTINTGNWISFKRDTYELLDKLIQAGVPVIINFTYKGKSYSVTIPAGSAVSLVSLCNKEGYCGFMNLYRVFGGTVK